MIEFIRGRGARRGIYFGAIAALGLTLSGCGGSGVSPAASAAPAQAASSPQSSVSAPSSSTGATGTAPAPSPTSSTSPPASSSPPTASTGNVTLNWTPPTQNVDGTTLTNLAGYDIHYGTASGKYTQTVVVNNPGIATYVVSNLTPGTYYFSVTAVNSQGTESPMSSEVSTTVN